MKESFAEFYQPSEEQLAALMQRGTIVLDANVLLNPYNVANEGREALLALLEKVQDRLWVPYQAALEFQRNRASAISGDRKKLQQALTNSQNGVMAIIGELRKLDLDKRGIGRVFDGIEDAFKAASDRAKNALEDAQKGQLDTGLDDPVRARLDKILAGRIGPPPESQAQLDALFKDGDQRYTLKIPPGFEDKSKDDHRYHHAGLNYFAKFGDLVLWKQTIAYAMENRLENVVLVTLDRKRDWWLLDESGDILGPLPNLISEVTREGGVRLFWLLHLPEFLHLANKHLLSDISDAAISQVVASDQPYGASALGDGEPVGHLLHDFNRELRLSHAVIDWFRSFNFDVRLDSEHNSDLVIEYQGNTIPVELVALQDATPFAEMLGQIRRAIVRIRQAVAFRQSPSALIVVDCDSGIHIPALEAATKGFATGAPSFQFTITIHLGTIAEGGFKGHSTVTLRRIE